MRDIFKLIAINLREDRQDDYFDIEPHLNDFYKKSTLSEEELTYFINHGNNVTIFIHGYNVPYGNFGRTIQTKEKEKLKNSIFSMQDIYRDNHMLINELHDANIEGKKLDPLRTILTNIIAYDSIKKTRFRRHPQDIDTVLNGKGAHNWWLHMEWNLNHATSQFDDTDYPGKAIQYYHSITWQRFQWRIMPHIHSYPLSNN